MKGLVKAFSSILIIILLASSCQQKTEGLEAIIADLEKKTVPPYSVEKVNELIKNYQNYVSTYPDRNDQNATYLRKGAMLAAALDQFPRSIELLSIAIKDHYSADNTLDNIISLGNIYQNDLKNEVLSAAVFQSAQIQYPQNDTLSKYISPKWVPFEDRIQQLKKEVVDTSTHQINYSAVNNFLNSCAIRAMVVPKNDRSADLLLEAGQLAHDTRTFNQALDLLEWFYLEYPNHEKASEALFITAYILDNELKRFDEAKILYESYLEKYPEAEFAETTQFLLDNLGVPDEEIIKQFEEKNKVESDE